MSFKRLCRLSIQYSVTFAIGALLIISCTQTPSSHNGPFDEKSTGEEVTKGLDLSGKNILITGVNSGLGYETMRVLAIRGAHIIGFARNMEKAQEACARVGGKTTPVACELTDFNSVVAAAETVKALNIPIDVLICNAEVYEVTRVRLVDGEAAELEKIVVPAALFPGLERHDPCRTPCTRCTSASTA